MAAAKLSSVASFSVSLHQLSHIHRRESRDLHQPVTFPPPLVSSLAISGHSSLHLRLIHSPPAVIYVSSPPRDTTLFAIDLRHLHRQVGPLAHATRPSVVAAAIITADLRLKAAGYHSQAARIHEILDTAFLSREHLSLAVTTSMPHPPSSPSILCPPMSSSPGPRPAPLAPRVYNSSCLFSSPLHQEASLNVMTHERVYTESWNYTKEAVLNGGILFNRVDGMSLYEYCGTDRMFNIMSNESMWNHSTVVMKKILEDYRGFGDVEVLIDVGGEIGVSLRMIVSEHPHLKGIDFDLPFVTVEAPVIAGIKHVGVICLVSLLTFTA